MCNLQGALQFIWIFIYQNFKISHRCFLEIFNLKRILSRLILRFVLAMPEFCNNRVILTANYVMISKPIFLQVSPTVLTSFSINKHRNEFIFDLSITFITLRRSSKNTSVRVLKESKIDAGGRTVGKYSGFYISPSLSAFWRTRFL